MKGFVRRDHRSTILDLLGERGPLGRAELAALAGLSPATVSRVVGSLVRAGYVCEGAVVAAGPGRPARQVQLRPDGAHVVGIDAGGSTLRGALADLDGSIRRRVSRPATDPHDADRLLDDLVAVAREAIGPAPRGRVLAVAAGVSGIVDHAAGRVLVSPDLPGLAGMDLAGRLEAVLGIGVQIDNDDVLAAVGEAAAGAARGAADVVFLSVGYGLGAGILVAGRPVRGASHAAGAVGFVGGPRLDERASGRAIPGLYAAAISDGRRPDGLRDDPSRAEDKLDARAIFERAAAGDGVAQGVVADAIAAIAEAAIGIAAIVDPEVIVLGGGLMAGAPQMTEVVGDRLRAALPFPPHVVPSALEGAAVVSGAVALALANARMNLPGDPDERDTGTAATVTGAPRRLALQLV